MESKIWWTRQTIGISKQLFYSMHQLQPISHCRFIHTLKYVRACINQSEVNKQIRNIQMVAYKQHILHSEKKTLKHNRIKLQSWTRKYHNFLQLTKFKTPRKSRIIKESKREHTVKIAGKRSGKVDIFWTGPRHWCFFLAQKTWNFPVSQNSPKNEQKKPIIALAAQVSLW